MLRFRFLQIPVTVELFFWVVVVLLGGGHSANGPEEWAGVVVWVAVVFGSILIHELGHAQAGRRFGAEPLIHLHSFGGLTFFPGSQFTRGQDIWVTAAGPLASLALGLSCWALLVGLDPSSPWARIALWDARFVNIGWTILNLMPVLPLDGGHLLRLFLGPNRAGAARWVGTLVAGALCVWAITTGRLFTALFFGYLAYVNFRAAQRPGEI